ncbi:PRK06851 family protein [Paenibacillus faecalis]|uniref:PRK06851 family protein n=1 Tax=Paenibacillus faecalis TaxID=2079532 RepID=UPI000D0FAB4F|nr:PRK06851 family protein [Paenibacillus faecalis]
MTAVIRNYFAAGNTARGFMSLLHSSLEGIESIFIVDGSPGSGNANLIRNIGDEMSRIGHELWILHSASDNDSIDGWIAPDLSIGMITGAAFRGMVANETESAIQFLNLDDTCVDLKGLSRFQSEIDHLNLQIKQAHEDAYAGFAQALHIHDDWEALYIKHMNFDAANEMTEEYIKRLYGEQTLNKQSRIIHRFLGAATPKGAIDFVPDLTQGLKRYLIKGRAGTGKSTMLKKIAAAGEERGFDVEIYHCGFDPNSIDMVIAREAGFAIFDSTAPHEYFPDRPSDEIIDTYARCVQPGTDERHEETLNVFKQQYSSKMKESTGHLAAAQSYLDQLKHIFTPFVDNDKVEEMQEELKREVLCIAQTQKH